VDHLPAVPEQPEAQGEQKQLLKGQSPPGQVQGRLVLREVDILIGVADVTEIVLLPHSVRENVR
jgi:hypothetical protein